MNKFTWNIKSVGLFAIAIILCSEYLLFPWLDWVSDTQDNIKSEQSRLNKQDKLITKANALENQRKALTFDFNERIKGFTVVKPNQDSAVFWLQELDSHIAKYDLVVNNKSPRREIEINSEFAVFVGKVNVKGEYSQILHFLDKLENEAVGNRVRQLRLTRNPAAKKAVVADIEFVKVFKRS